MVNCLKDKNNDETFQVELMATDCPGAKIDRPKKAIVTIVDDPGNWLFSAVVIAVDQN